MDRYEYVVADFLMEPSEAIPMNIITNCIPQPEDLVQILCFWTLSTILFLFKTQYFGGWILSPFSGKTYSVGPNH
jgi:hypothetical protein